MSEQFDAKGAWWVARPENKNTVFYILVVMCVLLVLIDLVYHGWFHSKHGNIDMESAIGFHAAYGFAAFLFVVTVGTKLRSVLQRPEDYYDMPYTPPPDDHHHHHDHEEHDHEEHKQTPDLDSEDSQSEKEGGHA
ncbi:MAG: hypothetical protein CMK59_04040 [Proteobacteria bacterium]|nr:hypothetical protein [Pseudomonadota bacterium]